MGIDNKTYAAAKTYANKVALGFQSVTQTATGFKITFKDGTTATYNVQNMHEHANKSILDLLSTDSNGNLLYDGKSISPDFIDTTGDGSKFLADDGTYKTVTTGGVAYDDTQVKADIQTNANDIATNKTNIATNTSDISDLTTKIGTETMGTTATTIKGAVKEINGNLLDTVSFSADYKNIVLNRKNGTNPYTIPIASIINHAKLIELADIDVTDIGNGKTLVYDATTQKHKYVSSSGTDEFVKMDSSTDAHYLADLIDKQTVVNDNGVLKVKKLDGQEVTIAEINYLKGLTMNVMDLVNTFANGGVKVINTPVATAADLATLDRSIFIDGISYIVYVLADENHTGAKTTYLVDKTNTIFFGNADSQRNFTTDPINLANEVTGKLGTSNIDVDSLWALLTIDDTYKTLTTKDEVFGTHGAKKLYDELTTSIDAKANATGLTTHTDDTDIHITTTERTKWNEVDNKANKTEVLLQDKIQTTTGAETHDNVYSAQLTKTELDLKANDTEVVKKTDILTANSTTATNEQVYGAFIMNTILNNKDNISKAVAEEINVDTVTKNIKGWCENLTGTVPNGNTAGWFENEYVNSTTINQKFISYNKIMYIRSMFGGTWSKWQRLCTTSVEDVGKTLITISDKTNYKNSAISESFYIVRNGICYVTLAIDCVSPSTNIVADTLPKTYYGIFKFSMGHINGRMDGYVLQDGTLKLSGGIAGTEYYVCSFSYPVAED